MVREKECSCYLLQLHEVIMAGSSLFDFLLKSVLQYGITPSWQSIHVVTIQILLATLELFFTPLIPPSPIVPIGGHSRFPQSRLTQSLQKLSRTCLTCNAKAPNPLLYVNMSGFPYDIVSISRASFSALNLKTPPFPD